MTLQAGVQNISGTLKLNMPAGYKSNPESVPFQFAKKGDVSEYKFQVETVKLSAIWRSASGSNSKW